MNKRIEKLVLHKFRGATTKTILEFDSKKPMALIFGENGTGKSSIIDAIDFLFNKSGGSIKTRSSTDEKKHLASIGNKAKDFAVELTYGSDQWVGVHTGKEIVINGNSSLPQAFILRRSQLLRLVEASPADSYKELRRFIDVQNVEDSEQALRNAFNEAKSRLNSWTGQKVEADAALHELWQGEGSPNNTEIDWASEKKRADTQKLQASLSETLTILQQFAAALMQQNNYQTAQQTLRSKTQEWTQLQNQISAGSQTQEANRKLVQMLKQVESYLAAPLDKDHCPTCLSTYQVDKLRREVATRIADMTVADEVNAKFADAEKATQNAHAVVEQSRKNFTQAAQTCTLSLQKSKLPEIDKAKIDWTTYSQLLSGDTQLQATEAERLLSDTNLLRLQLEKLKAQMQKDLSQHKAITQAYERVVNAGQQATEQDLVTQKLKQVLDVVHDIRIAFTDQVLEAVKNECSRLYSRLHPDEPYTLTRLFLNLKTKGSLHLAAHFDGYDEVSPQAYFSESHLDTLGFCLWLAIAKLSSNGNALVVLDDAFTSVDAQHIDRIIDLLTDESDSFNQIIITTHSRRWLDKYRNSDKPKNKTYVLELLRWQRMTGICAMESKLEVAELREKLNPFQKLDRQAVCSQAGVLLERALDHLAKLYGCRMARNRDNAYTLKPLCDATKELFKKIKIKRLRKDASGVIIEPNNYEPSLQPLWQKISDHVIVRNQVGAHFNANAVEYSDADIEDFGHYAVDIVSGLVCHTCDSLAQTNKGAYFACGCGMLRMEPYKI
ncbi:MAG: AAA family ATPase [Acidobacteria bacterium]|nr:AAA family ATPase [Acidobacteriota bacterium]